MRSLALSEREHESVSKITDNTRRNLREFGDFASRLEYILEAWSRFSSACALPEQIDFRAGILFRTRS
jgi:hypothetical protein